MTSTLGINESQPRNLETPRFPELIPEQIRGSANTFNVLLTEYYKFLNINSWTTSTVSLNSYTISTTTGTVLSGKSGSGPSNILYSILSQLDTDQVDADYISHIQSTIAPLVPIPTYMSSTSTIGFYNRLKSYDLFASPRASLYQKIVKYFYNTRGSIDSTKAFFHLFYNDSVEVNYVPGVTEGTMQSYIQTWLTTSGMALSATTSSAIAINNSVRYRSTPLQAWTPYSYFLITSIPASSFDLAYRALVHPVGFKYFIQPSLSTGIIEQSESRMVDARYDYQNLLWLIDSTQITEYNNYIISDAGAAYSENNQNTAIMLSTSTYTYSGYTYADWSNVGVVSKFAVSILNPITASTFTISVGTYSINNIVPGMLVTSTASGFSALTTVSSVATSSGLVTLTTSPSSTIATNTIITFSV